ncbi:hypothetical protein GQ600_17806 [Phytophthora cactorum]|nr:hypothetical protein GQ600_17806 [Phytophthora cactorum]
MAGWSRWSSGRSLMPRVRSCGSSIGWLRHSLIRSSEVFGEHVKPRLKKLTFAVNMLWEYISTRWMKLLVYLLRITTSHNDQATDVSSAMKGCPALDDLEIELYHPADEDETEYNDPYNAGTVDFPEHEVLNIDIYDDKFCETLVKHCPLLTKFSIWEVAEGHSSNLTPIRTFTDQGLVALAKLKYLTALELDHVRLELLQHALYVFVAEVLATQRPLVFMSTEASEVVTLGSFSVQDHTRALIFAPSTMYVATRCMFHRTKLSMLLEFKNVSNSSVSTPSSESEI